MGNSCCKAEKDTAGDDPKINGTNNNNGRDATTEDIQLNVTSEETAKPQGMCHMHRRILAYKVAITCLWFSYVFHIHVHCYACGIHVSGTSVSVQVACMLVSAQYPATQHAKLLGRWSIIIQSLLWCTGTSCCGADSICYRWRLASNQDGLHLA